MRTVQVIEKSSGNITRADHVIGIDESGNITGAEPFALAAVRCPREEGETLARLLLEHDLEPWRGKSTTLARNVSSAERDRRVEGLIDSLSSEGIQWRATGGYDTASIHHKAACVCTLAKKTITSIDGFRGDSVVVPDGAPSMYGTSQEHLRTQAAQIFDGPFQSTFGGVYITGLAGADVTYPEVIAADYIAGYVRNSLENGRPVHDLPNEVVRFEHGWREPGASPTPFYQIHGVNGHFGEDRHTRIAAWIKGRHPDGRDHDVSSQWENTVRMLESRELQQHLLEELGP